MPSPLVSHEATDVPIDLAPLFDTIVNVERASGSLHNAEQAVTNAAKALEASLAPLNQALNETLASFLTYLSISQDEVTLPQQIAELLLTAFRYAGVPSVGVYDEIFLNAYIDEHLQEAGLPWRYASTQEYAMQDAFEPRDVESLPIVLVRDNS